MCLFQFGFPQGICLGVGLLGHMVLLFLVFKGISILSSTVFHFSILVWRIPMDRGAWQAKVYGVTKSQARLSDLHTHAHEIR